MTHLYRHISTPVGRLELVASDVGLAAVLWQDDDPQRVRIKRQATTGRHAVLDATQQQLDEYFAGRRRAFSVALDFHGTAFQKDVWQALLTIPYGQTRSYGQIAAQIGRPKASRAVGAANGRNPISIITPCHRVIGANGALTGFAGGMAVKQQLLRLESDTPDLLTG